MKLTYLLTYFHANMELLNKIREFTLEHNASIQLISKKQVNKSNKYIKNLVYGKLILITLEGNLESQINFTNKLNEFVKSLNIYINNVIIDNTYYTITNLNKLYEQYKINKANIINYYSIIYIFNTLKQVQNQHYLSLINYFNLKQHLITSQIIKNII